MRTLLLGLVMVLLLAGCGSKTTVVLLPDDKGAVGELEVSGPGGAKRISEAYTYTEVSGSRQPAEVKKMDAGKVEALFGDALKAQPLPTESHLLYFFSDKVTLKPQSKRQLPVVVQAITARSAPEITIIGHTDRLGHRVYNLQLSLRRAKAIKALLVKQGIPENIMTIFSHGENDPLVPTKDGVSEPKNRRVEIFIR